MAELLTQPQYEDIIQRMSPQRLAALRGRLQELAALTANWEKEQLPALTKMLTNGEAYGQALVTLGTNAQAMTELIQKAEGLRGSMEGMLGTR